MKIIDPTPHMSATANDADASRDARSLSSSFKLSATQEMVAIPRALKTYEKKAKIKLDGPSDASSRVPENCKPNICYQTHHKECFLFSPIIG